MNQPVSLSANTFVLGVSLNLLAGENLNQYDVRLVYTGFNDVLRANTTLDYSNNVFSGQTTDFFLVCVDRDLLQGTACAPEDGLGTVHVIQTVRGGQIKGPINGLLFKITFNILKQGSSVFTFDAARLFNPGDQLNPSISYVQDLTEGGVFANSGVVAFFNYWPGLPQPSILPHQDAVFDASLSIDANTNPSPIANYTWTWGDSSPDSVTTSSVIHHTFSSPKNYTVRLVVSTQNGGKANLTRTVPVSPALGSLFLTVLDQQGSEVRFAARVLIFNSSSSVNSFGNKTTDFGGNVLFTGLVPGTYSLKLSGPTVISQTATATVTAGWQNLNTIYVHIISGDTPSYFGDVLFFGTMAAGLGIFGVALYWTRKRSAAKRKGRISIGSSKAAGKQKIR